MTLEEVKEHFKDAEKVVSTWGAEFDYTNKTRNVFFHSNGCFYVLDSDREERQLTRKDGTLAKIVTYKTKQMKNYINIEGKEIELTEEQIKLIKESIVEPVKGLPNTWEELKRVNGFYTGVASDIGMADTLTRETNKNVFATKEQAEASIALAQLSQLKAVYNGKWVADWSEITDKHKIIFCEDELVISCSCYSGAFLSFKDEETRDLFLENFRELIMKAKPLMS